MYACVAVEEELWHYIIAQLVSNPNAGLPISSVQPKQRHAAGSRLLSNFANVHQCKVCLSGCL